LPEDRGRKNLERRVTESCLSKVPWPCNEGKTENYAAQREGRRQRERGSNDLKGDLNLERKMTALMRKSSRPQREKKKKEEEPFTGSGEGTGPSNRNENQY